MLQIITGELLADVLLVDRPVFPMTLVPVYLHQPVSETYGLLEVELDFVTVLASACWHLPVTETYGLLEVELYFVTVLAFACWHQPVLDELVHVSHDFLEVGLVAH